MSAKCDRVEWESYTINIEKINEYINQWVLGTIISKVSTSNYILKSIFEKKNRKIIFEPKLLLQLIKLQFRSVTNINIYCEY